MGVGVAVGVGVGVTVGVGAGPPLSHEYRSLFGDDVPTMFVTMPVVVALLMACATVAGFADGFEARYIAAIPATSGADIDVPLRTRVAESLLMPADVTAFPGANRSTHGP
jgi:hypothetical protein